MKKIKSLCSLLFFLMAFSAFAQEDSKSLYETVKDAYHEVSGSKTEETQTDNSNVLNGHAAQDAEDAREADRKMLDNQRQLQEWKDNKDAEERQKMLQEQNIGN